MRPSRIRSRQKVGEGVMVYMHNAIRHLTVVEQMIEHVEAMYGEARQQLTPADLPDVERLLAVEGHISQKFAGFEQQMVGDLIAARRVLV